MTIQADELKEKLRGKWVGVISALAPGLGPGMQSLKKPQPCPRCQGTDRFNFDKDFEENGAIWCRHCELKCPDGIETLMKFNHWTFQETLNELAGYLGETPTPEQTDHKGQPMTHWGGKGNTSSNNLMPEPTPKADTKKQDLVKKIWAETISADTNLFLETYLQSRGLSGEVPDTIRFHPALYHNAGDITYDPALVAKIQNLNGDLIGIQRIYLNKFGDGKSECLPNKMILASLAGISGGCVQLAPATQSYLCVTEGIETGLAVMELTGQPVWASVTSELMKTMQIPDNVKELWIFADKDEAGKKAAEVLATKYPTLKCYIRYPAGEGDWLDEYALKSKAALLVEGDLKPFVPLKDYQFDEDDYIVMPDPEEGTPEAAKQFNYTILTDKELAEGHFPIEYLVNGVLVKGQPCVMGAPKKTMKTSLLIELAYSLASGVSFLDNFKVNGQHHVGIMSAESGMGTLQETAKRIRLSKKIDTQNLFWCSEVPHLDNDERVAALHRFVTICKLDVLILDPAYLMMCGLGAGASNLFEVGKFLGVITDLCEKTGVTPIIAHHTIKGAGIDFSPLELESIAFAGFQEWARQWILLSRRCRYNPEIPGNHELWMVTGGSAGHTGQWGVDIREGSIDDNFGRIWETEIVSSGNIYREREDEKQLVKENKAAEKARKNEEIAIEKVLSYLAGCPDGDSKTQISIYTGMNNTKTAETLAKLIDLGKVRVEEMAKGNQKVEGYVIVNEPL